MNLSANLKSLFKSWQTLVKQHNEIYRKKLQHRCEIVCVQKNPQTNHPEIVVKMFGIKKQVLVKFSPEEILVNDALLMEFCQTDVRAITFCALQHEQAKQTRPQHKFKVVSQEFSDGQTLFIITETATNTQSRISAHELFSSNILSEFNFEDIRNIIYTATSEHLLDSELRQE